MSANVVRIKFIACVMAISFSQMACSLDEETEKEIKNAASEVKGAASGVKGAASGVKGAARGVQGAASDFRSFLPVIVVILIVQTLVGILNLITRWRIMRSIFKLYLHLSSATPDDQSGSATHEA